MKLMGCAVVVVVVPVCFAADPEVRVDDAGFAAVAGFVDDGSPKAGSRTESLTEWTPIGPFGGDVQDVAASPTDPNMVLAAVAPGGSTGGTLYRSTDGGATWATVPTLAGLSVWDIEFDTTGIAYIGTIDGVWKSTNNGVSFTAQNLGIGLNDQTFDVAIDPTNNAVLYCAVADAIGSQTQLLMKSVNSGANWSNVTPPGQTNGGKAIAIDPANSQRIMAVFAGAFGGGQAWFSNNGGTSWTDVSAGLPNRPLNDVICQNGTWVIAGGQLFGGQTVGVYRSVNDGSVWTAIHDGTWPNAVATDVEALPGDPDGLLVATVNGVHKTTDDGDSWTLSTGGTAPFSMNSVRFSPGSSTVVYGGANSFGVVKSDDGLSTSTVSSVGIGALDVYSIDSNPANPDEIAIAFQGLNNGGIYASLDRGQTWSVQTGLPGSRYNTVKFSPTGVLYALNDGPTGGGVLEGLYRRNGVGSWTPLGPDQGTLFESELFGIDFGTVDPALIVLSGSDFGVAGFEPTVWRSRVGGWDKVHEGFTGTEDFEDVNAVHIARDGTEQVMVACFTDFGSPQTGGVLRSTDGGATWTRVTGGGLAAGVQGFDLSPSPDDALTFLLADGDTGSGNGGVWKTTDGGANWTKQGSIEGVRTIVADPNDGQHLVIGTSFVAPRVRESVDGGLSFTDFMQGLAATVSVRDLGTGGGSSPAVYLSTGSGCYSRDLPAAGCPADLTTSSDPNDPTYGIPDGVVDGSDFFYYLDQFAANNLAVADLTTTSDPNDPGYGVPDGVLDASDFFVYLDLFALGCP